MRELQRYGSLISRAGYIYKAERTFQQQRQVSYDIDSYLPLSSSQALWVLIKHVADLPLLDRIAYRIAIVDELLRKL